MRPVVRPLRQALLVLGILLCVAALAGRFRLGGPSVRIEAGKPAFRHDEFIRCAVRIKPAWLRRRIAPAPLEAFVFHRGAPVITIAGQTAIPLAYDRSRGLWTGAWPCPWNAPEGSYTLRLSTAGVPALSGIRPEDGSFRIESRKPLKTPDGFTVLTVEDLTPLSGIRWPGPDGRRKDWTVLVDWAEFLKVDALWILSAESGGYSRKLSRADPWNARPPADLQKLGRECHRRGIRFGAWAMCYLIGGTPERSPDYRYAWEYDEGRLTDGRTRAGRRAISIMDPDRPGHIARLVGSWAGLPEVDHVGLDYIRNALGGCELAEPFVEEMKISVPPEWKRWSREERMIWVARKKVARQDPAFIDAWQWWRAHKVSEVIRTIREAVGPKKPLWAFTLSWEKGWQHGQDPVMFRDAGADLDAVMLYECDKNQFGALVRDWKAYLDCPEVPLLAGNVVDWSLHQNDGSGPLEFKRRMLTGYRELCQNGPVKGVFIHDLFRAVRGRTGPWGTLGWMKTAASVVEEVKGGTR